MDLCSADNLKPSSAAHLEALPNAGQERQVVVGSGGSSTLDPLAGAAANGLLLRQHSRDADGSAV